MNAPAASAAAAPLDTPPPPGVPSAAPPRFADVVEAADALSDEDQEALVELLRRRLALRGRGRLVERVAASRRDFEEGRFRRATVEEIMREATS